jgi:glutamate carboxypeptidase
LLAGNAMAQKPHQATLDAATQQKEEALKLLERMVNIDSGSASTEGLDKVRGIAVDELRKLGARIETFPAEPHPGTNVVATLTGQGKKKILILAHIDTVFKEGTAAAKPFYIKDGRAYGPGVMDNKGGVVAGLQALKILQKIGFKDYGQITFLIDTNEEVGSVGTSALIERVAKQHDVALNLEPGRPADGLVVERKGSATALIEVKGLASHAGVAPDAGRNAAMEVAHQVLQLSKTADAAKKTTVNFTVLTANGPTNVIPASASAKGDVRAATPEELDRVEKDLACIGQAGCHGRRHLRRDRQEAHHREQRRRGRRQPGGGRGRAGARRLRHRGRRHPHAGGIRRGRERGAAALSAVAHADGPERELSVAPGNCLASLGEPTFRIRRFARCDPLLLHSLATAPARSARAPNPDFRGRAHAFLHPMDGEAACRFAILLLP